MVQFSIFQTMNKLKLSFCRWQAALKIINEYAGEYICKKGIRWMFFEIYVIRQIPPLQLCDPQHRFVTAEGNILTTESDEQDRLYICNRSRGFEISYHDYEITLKNGKICVYRHGENSFERIPFEDTTLNQNLKI